MADKLLYKLNRVVHAPVSRVFAAWTDADQLAAWCGPVGFTTPRESVSIDSSVDVGQLRGAAIEPGDGPL